MKRRQSKTVAGSGGNWQVPNSLFRKMDFNKDGFIDLSELTAFIKQAGFDVTERAIFELVSDFLDDNGSLKLTPELLSKIVADKKTEAENSVFAETLDAFVALGGGADGGGAVKIADLVDSLSEVFGPGVSRMDMLAEFGKNETDSLDFAEFRTFLNE